MTKALPVLKLKRNEERRIRRGHLWIFSNEVDVAKTPLKAFEPGEVVEIQDARGKTLGTGYVNPHSLIAARLVSRDPRHPFDASLIVHRLKVALALRERVFDFPYYRLVFGEGDGLPGLVVDRFDDRLVVQITTAGMERMRQAVVDALDKVLRPRQIILDNDTSIRELEGLERYVEPLGGPLPGEIEVVELGTPFVAPLAQGQKTGWFYDQADNRRDLGRWVHGARVLDVFSYVGGWAVQALKLGARSALCVDQSARALEYAARNAECNGFGNRIGTLQGDAFSVLKQLKQDEERFDVVIVDPPAFIKRKKDFRQGLEAYQRINALAMSLLTRDGILISCSCSSHLGRGDLIRALNRAARHLGGRDIQLLWQGGQAADHPVHPAIPETEYLKAIVCRVTR